MLIGQLALAIAAAFAGAAFYVGAVVQPARLALDDRALLAEWKASRPRGARMQGALALVAGGLGLAVWWLTGDWRWIVGAVLILAPWPYTIIGIGPTNRALDALPLEAADAASRRSIESWGRMHAARTILGVAATAAYLLALN